MQIPLQIEFDDFGHCAAVDAYIREEIQSLEPYGELIASARVIVARPQHRYRFSKTYEVRIHLATPDASEICVHGNSPIVAVDEDIYVAIDDAFEIARRRAQDVAGTQPHAAPSRETARQVGL